MMDTSALLAALIVDHEHHDLARRHLSLDTQLPVIVIAETYSQLRRTFGQTASTASSVIEPWASDPSRMLATKATSVAATFARATELDLGGNIHDALIAQVCADARVRLVTLDGRQHRIALAIGAESTYLLA